MTIYDFINLLTSDDNMVFTLFDCNTEDLVYVDTGDGDKEELCGAELMGSEYADYDICSMDTWVEDDGRIHIEFNIEEE